VFVLAGWPFLRAFSSQFVVKSRVDCVWSMSLMSLGHLDVQPVIQSLGR